MVEADRPEEGGEQALLNHARTVSLHVLTSSRPHARSRRLTRADVVSLTSIDAHVLELVDKAHLVADAHLHVVPRDGQQHLTRLDLQPANLVKPKLLEGA